MKNKKRKDAKVPQTTGKESWIRGFGDDRLQKLLADRAKMDPRGVLSGKSGKVKGSAPGFIYMRPICQDFDCPGWPNPDSPPKDPCAGMNFVWQPDIAVRMVYDQDCPSDPDLRLLEQAVRGNLSNFSFPNPDVRATCQNRIISISIWGSSVKEGSCGDIARQQSHIPDEILFGGDLLGIYINAGLIRRLAQDAFDKMPKTLDSGGNPNDNGPIHLTSLSVGFPGGNLVETYVGGYDDRPWPDVSFTTTITDYLGDIDHPDHQKTGTTSADTVPSRWDEFLAVLAGVLSIALTYALPVLFPLTSFALLRDIETLLLQPDNPTTAGVGLRVLELLPDYIPLPQTGAPLILARSTAATSALHQKKEKLVLTYNVKPKADERGLFVAASPSRHDRTPRVHIIGPTSLTIVANAQGTFGYYTAEPDDFYGQRSYAWSGGSTPQNPGQRTKISFARGTAKPGGSFQRTVKVRVTDLEGSVATASLTVSIYVNDSSDFPAICKIKPWLPECQP